MSLRNALDDICILLLSLPINVSAVTTVSGPAVLCIDEGATYTVTWDPPPISGYSNVWSSSDPSKVAVVISAEEGTFKAVGLSATKDDVTVKVNDSLGNSASMSVTVVELKRIVITAGGSGNSDDNNSAGNAAPVCVSNAVTFTAVMTNVDIGGSGVEWSVQPPGGGGWQPQGAGKESTLTFPQTGTYEVKAECASNYVMIVVVAFKVDINPTWDIVTEGADSGDFEAVVTPTGLPGLTHSWSWEPIVLGGGNDPSVTFSSPNSSTTRVNRSHWYAVPDTRCASNRVSEYRLWGAVTVGGATCSNSATISVELKDPAEEVIPAYIIIGNPATNYDAASNIWYVSGTGTLSRELTISTNWNLHANSEFADKMMAHAGQHTQDYINGFDGHEFFTVNELYSRFSSLTDSTSTGLISKIFQEWADYKRAEGIDLKNLKPCFEARAYNASDAVAPDYYYSNCGRYSCP